MEQLALRVPRMACPDFQTATVCMVRGRGCRYSSERSLDRPTKAEGSRGESDTDSWVLPTLPQGDTSKGLLVSETRSALRAAQHFAGSGTLTQLVPLGQGLIHGTFQVQGHSAAQSALTFVLQRLNRHVFPCPEEVVNNVRAVTTHLAQKCPPQGALRFPQLLPAEDGLLIYRDPDGEVWRALSFIEHSHSRDTLENLEQARDIGCVLGQFHRLLGDLDPVVLRDTLPGFHIATDYLIQLDTAWDTWTGTMTEPLRTCRAFIEERRALVPVLEDAKAAGVLPLRVMHGDPKVNNFLFDAHSDRVVSLIDLDTVKPGLIHYDLGDCLRSACNRAGEDPLQPHAVHFDLAIARAILEGYLTAAGMVLRPREFDFILPAIRLIPLELGMRFLTDYLSGNRYFHVRDPEHNLRRAQVQFRLVASIENQAADLEHLIRAAGASAR